MPTLAKQLLTEAGFPDGFDFTLDTPTYDPHPLVAEFIKCELAKVGITVNINTITADEWYTKVYQKHDFAGDAAGARQRPRRGLVRQPRLLLGLRQPAGHDSGSHEAEQATKTVDEQTAKLKHVNEQIAKDAASDWLYLYPQIVVASSTSAAIRVNGLNSQFFAYGIVKK